MDDWLTLPRPAPTGLRKGYVRVEVCFSAGGGKPMTPSRLAALFKTKRHSTYRIRPVNDPEAETMGPWA